MGMRAQPVANDSAISAFWSWWESEGGRRASTDPTDGDLAERLTHQVARIREGLEWHLSAPSGGSGRPTLVVGSGGDPAHRAAAEAWLRAAPPAPGEWEFRTSRPADLAALSQRIRADGDEIDLAEIRFQVIDRADGRHDIAVHHPRFGDLDREPRIALAFHALDWTMGEDLVGRWVGAIDAPRGMPATGLTAAELAARIAEDEAARDPEAWIAGQIDGARPLVCLVRRDLDRFDLPAHYLHHAITTKYRAQRNGLPTESELRRLQDDEDVFDSVGAGVVGVAVVTSGRRRIVHLYSDGSAEALKAVDAAARRVKRKATAAPDPAWTAIGAFRPRG